ncbi:unnamed protein product [Alternaria alternata]
MRFVSALAVAAATVSSALAQDFVLGFNSGASDDTGKAKTQEDFEKEFTTAQSLEGAPGNFSAIRLYSNIQWETTDTPIAAFPAAIATNSKLLLGIWASGTDNIDNELKALNSAVEEYGTKLTDLVIGLSVGSEDLYRVSTCAEKIVEFIKTARERLADTPLKGVKITHVDTWTAWVNESNKAVIDEIDFLAAALSSAISATEGVAGDKDVWITETGWAYSGPDFGAATSTVDNAETYWKDVGCALSARGKSSGYTLRDANPANKVKFAISDKLSTTPRFDISCPEQKELPSAEPATNNGTSTGGSSSSNSTTDSGNNDSSSSNNTNGGSDGGNGNAQQSGAAAPSGTGAGAATSVSVMNSMAMALSVVFAAAAWAL